MNDFEQLKEQLHDHLKPKRYQHTLGVILSADELAMRFGADREKTALAALLHDCAKNYSDKDLLKIAKNSELELDEVTLREPQLLHGPVGAVVAEKEYGVHDREILDAITYHTTGRVNMTLMDKIIYLADFIEPNRDYPHVNDLRKSCKKDSIDDACILAFSNTIRYIVSIDGLIHSRTIDARNYLIIQKNNIKK